MKKKITTNRLTIDLTDKNKFILEKMKGHLMSPFGTIVNNIITTFCDTPKNVNDELLNFCKKQLKLLYKQMDNASSFDFCELSEKAQAYLNIAIMLNQGEIINIEEVKEEPNMIRYDIENGYVVCPDDWIVVNPQMAAKCIYAGVVECRRKEYNVPHFLFFTNRRSREFDTVYCNEINELCCKAWPKFREILTQQVEPIEDVNGMLLNADEWMRAPQIGHFQLYIQGDDLHPANYTPPMGAMVVHTEK